MAIQENVPNNNRMPTPDELGKMAELYAPDVPLNFALGVMSQESDLGRNPAAAKSRLVGISATTGRQQSVIGPGQILDSEESYQKGLPISMAAHWYKKTTGQTYQPGNLQHATIAAFARINNDYVKSNGDDLEFSKKYFGGGTDEKSGNKTANDYVLELRQKIYKLGGLESTGNVPVQAKLNTLTGADDPAVRQAGALAAEQRKADGTNLVETMRRTGEDVINSLMGIREAAINTINTEAADSVAKAGQAKDFMIKALGFDPTGDTNNITAAGKVLDKNLGDLLNLQEGLANAKANPIFAILDGMSGGKVSKQFAGEIEQRQKIATDISQSINQLHTLAKNASSIGMDTVSQMSEASRLAKIQTLNAKYLNEVAVASGKTDIEAAKVDIKTAEAIKNINDATERNARQAEVMELRKAKQENDDLARSIRQAQEAGKFEATIKQMEQTYEKGKLAIAAQEAKAQENLAKSEAKQKLATTLGTTPAELDLAAKNKDPVITELLTNPKSLGALEYKASKGKLDPEEKTARNLAFGIGGWASKTENVWAAGLSAQLDKAMVGKDGKPLPKTPANTILKDNEFAKLLSEKQDSIVNDSKLQKGEHNPYGAKHELILSQNETMLRPVFEKSEAVGILAKEVYTSRLYLYLIQEKKAGAEIKGDDQVINQALKLFKASPAPYYSSEQAVTDINNYFKLAMEVNNVSKNYTAVGLEPQTRYGVNFFNVEKQATSRSLVGNAFLVGNKELELNRENKPSVNSKKIDLADRDSVSSMFYTMAIQQRNQ